MHPHIKSVLYFGLFISTGLLVHRCILTYIKVNTKATVDTRKAKEKSLLFNSGTVNGKSSPNETENDRNGNERKTAFEENKDRVAAIECIDAMETSTTLEMNVPHNLPLLKIHTIEMQEPNPLLDTIMTNERERTMASIQNELAVASEGFKDPVKKENFESSLWTSNLENDCLDATFPNESNSSQEGINHDAVSITHPPSTFVEPISPISKNDITLLDSHFESKMTATNNDLSFPHHDNDSADFFSPPTLLSPPAESEIPIGEEPMNQHILSDPYATAETTIHLSQPESMNDECLSLDQHKGNKSLNLAAPAFIPSTLAPPSIEVYDEVDCSSLQEKNVESELSFARCHYWPQCKYAIDCVYWHPIHLCPNENLAGFNPTGCLYASRCVFYHIHELKFLETKRIYPPFPRSKGLIPPNYKYLAQYSSTFDTNDIEEYQSDVYSDATDSQSISNTTFESQPSSEPNQSYDDVFDMYNGESSVNPEYLHLDDVVDDDNLTMEPPYPAECTAEPCPSDADMQSGSARSIAHFNINAPEFLPRFLKSP